MTTASDRSRAERTSGARSPELRAIAVLGLALGVFWFVALLTHERAGLIARLGAGLPSDLCGPAGRRLAAFSLAWVGALAAPLLPVATVLGALRLWGVRAPAVRWGAVASLVWIGLVPVLLHLADASGSGVDVAGGEYGFRLGQLVLGIFGRAGAWIVFIAAAIATALWIGGESVERALSRLDGAVGWFRGAVSAARHRLGNVRSAWRVRRAEAGRRAAGPRPAVTLASERPEDDDGVPAVAAPAGAEVGAARSTIGRAMSGAGDERPAPLVIRRTEEGEGADSPPPARPPRERKSVLPRRPEGKRSAADARPSPDAVPVASGPAPRHHVRRDPDVRKRPAAQYTPPPVSLLSTPPRSDTAASREELLELSETLGRTLEEFGIRGRVGEVHPGPIITRYDFEPAPGVKVNQVVSRVDDIALALRSDRIRILTRVPGKAAVGIEIPNERPELIHFRDVVTSRAFRDGKGILKLALGKDTAGRPFVDALETMPHLLVAGATGSGKSVGLNTMIVSLLLQHRPEDLRLIMIDPKMLELTGYNDIPHLALPVVTEPKEAAKALNWLVLEMERRYRMLAGRGVRNIQSYREKYFPGGKAISVPSDEEPPEPMPYFVCIVDELADLMMTVSNDVETPIARLAQMARAVGIHLILATQRPSVDVITGLIKANFPARLAFQVASRTDSRTVLDQNGAENLVGRGDMLFLPPGRPAPIRVHGAFLTDADIETLTAYIRSFASDLGHIEIDDKTGPDGAEGGADFDELFGEAARIVVTHGQASTSFLQRRLKIGYSRAGRLMDQLETAGIVSGFEGSKARDVLMDIDELEEQGIG